MMINLHSLTILDLHRLKGSDNHRLGLFSEFCTFTIVAGIDINKEIWRTLDTGLSGIRWTYYD